MTSLIPILIGMALLVGAGLVWFLRDMMPGIVGLALLLIVYGFGGLTSYWLAVAFILGAAACWGAVAFLKN